MKKFFLIASLILSIGAYAQVPTYVPTTGLKGWWSFTGNANDGSGNGNNGTVNGATLTTDRNGNANSAYSFVGINNILINPSSSLDINTSITISVWIKSTAYSGDIVWRGDNQTGRDPYAIVASPATLSFRRDVGTGSTNNIVMASTASLDTTIFHNIIGVYDEASNAQSIYVDGVLIQQQFLTGAMNYNTSGFFNVIGSTLDGTLPFQGIIDDIGIWNRTLSQQEISSLYTGCSTCSTPTNISATNISNTQATITWTGNSCAVKYRIRYRVQGTTTWTLAIVNAPITTKSLTQLINNATYEYQVRSDCNSSGSFASAYSNIHTFSANCITVTSTTNTTICHNQLPYNWNGNDYVTAGTFSITLVSVEKPEHIDHQKPVQTDQLS